MRLALSISLLPGSFMIGAPGGNGWGALARRSKESIAFASAGNLSDNNR